MEIFYIDCKKFEMNKSNDKKFIQRYFGRYIVFSVAKEVYKIPNPELETVNNKPKFKFSDINFSISHSKDIVLAAFDKNPVGVDVEYMSERNFQKLGRRYNLNNPTKERFYEFWTRYEAEFKLQMPPQKILTFPFFDEYMLSLAGDFEDYKIYEFSDFIENPSYK